MKKLAAAFLAVLLSAWAAQAVATVDVAVIDRATGQRIPAWNYHGRSYIAGAPGAGYSVRVTNQSGARVLAVVSVDGVNVITGQTASHAQSGYVLDPWGSVDIAGWRKNMSEVAAFYFTHLPDSYAARTDRPDNVGVIGVAVFNEAAPIRPRAPAAINRGQASSEAARDEAYRPESLTMPEQRLGTGHGEREASAARWTQFRRTSPYPNAVVTLHYDSRANLALRGIGPSAPSPWPNPFPGFVPDPRG
jgi:hypothetical protein